MQKRIGNKTERQVLQYLRDHGYWCHLFATTATGQPCDIIAIKDDMPILIDVKHCDGDRFSYNRIEANQASCFEYAKLCGISKVGFAVCHEDEIKWLPYEETQTGTSKKVKEMECIFK